jgi:protein gp37
MAQQSSIEWTNATWNPVTGCTKISPGCKNCYAERMAKRLQAMGQPRYRDGFSVTLQPDVLNQPLRWNKPQLIFVNSMSDLFHERIPFEYIEKVFGVMLEAKHHVFQILTKRAERLAEVANRLTWPPNVWMGVSIENQAYAWRTDFLRKVPAAVRFLSVEPLLGPVTELSLEDIHWVIAGGESGPHCRVVQPEWVRSIRDLCVQQEVAFFFKQWGGVRKGRHGRLLDGRTWDEMPKQVGPPLEALSV